MSATRVFRECYYRHIRSVSHPLHEATTPGHQAQLCSYLSRPDSSAPEQLAVYAVEICTILERTIYLIIKANPPCDSRSNGEANDAVHGRPKLESGRSRTLVTNLALGLWKPRSLVLLLDGHTALQRLAGRSGAVVSDDNLVNNVTTTTVL